MLCLDNDILSFFSTSTKLDASLIDGVTLELKIFWAFPDNLQVKQTFTFKICVIVLNNGKKIKHVGRTL